MDITETLAPKSDQLNADDLIGGPRTVTITGVSRGDADQPVNLATAEFGDGRPFKPCKSMRRVLVSAWGSDASAYVGRRLTLYRDDKVQFAGQDVGGIRISHMSHLEKRMRIALTATRGRRAPFTVDPLPDQPELPAADTTRLIRRMHVLFKEADTSERDDRLIITRRIVGRDDITSSNDLTQDEMQKVVDRLGQWQRDGDLGQRVTDLLNEHTLAEESGSADG